jgi:hypothetical protein
MPHQSQVWNITQADTTGGNVKRIVTGAVSSICAKGEAVGAVRTKRMLLARARKRIRAHKMTRWASATLVLEDDDDGDKWDDHCQCSKCNHRGINGTLCPTCEDTGFIHASTGVRWGWQARLSQDQASRDDGDKE